MKAIKTFVLFFALIIFILNPSCTTDHNHAEDDHHSESQNSDDDHSSSNSEEVELTLEQLDHIGAVYEKITLRKIRSLVKLTGRVELPPLGRSIAGSVLDGKITGVYTRPGQYVNKGQKLFELENLSIVDWQQELVKERAHLTYLRNELERQKSLSDDEIAPLKNYQLTESEVQRAEATIQGLKSKLDAIGISTNQQSFQTRFAVLAPASGVVQHISGELGSYVDASTSLAEIIDNRNLHLHLSAYGSDITKLQKGQMINFFIQFRPNEVKEARIFWINTFVDQQSNSYDVHAEIVGSNQSLTPGEFVEARVINQEQEMQTLPQEAVTMDKGLKYIFAKEEQHEDAIHFLKLQIQTGESDLGFVEILPVDPIPVDAEIVTNGAFFLMAQSKKGEEGVGHSH